MHKNIQNIITCLSSYKQCVHDVLDQIDFAFVPLYIYEVEIQNTYVTVRRFACVQFMDRQFCVFSLVYAYKCPHARIAKGFMLFWNHVECN